MQVFQQFKNNDSVPVIDKKLKTLARNLEKEGNSLNLQNAQNCGE